MLTFCVVYYKHLLEEEVKEKKEGKNKIEYLKREVVEAKGKNDIINQMESCANKVQWALSIRQN